MNQNRCKNLFLKRETFARSVNLLPGVTSCEMGDQVFPGSYLDVAMDMVTTSL